MNKPLVGVTSLINYEAKEYRMQRDYMNFIENAGGSPVILPLTSDRDVIRTVISRLDGILFTGGPDIHPKFFGEQTSPYCGYISNERDENELAIFAEVFKTEMPIFGICRGLQLINVALGGTLYQDIPTELEYSLDHSMSEKFRGNMHTVEIEKGSPLYDIFGKGSVEVNSFHHQSVKKLASGLRLAGVAEDGVIEAAFSQDDRFICGVQWHPERMIDADTCSMELAKEFIRQCLAYGAKNKQ